MTFTRDNVPAFDTIAAEVGPVLVRLGRAASGGELAAVRDEVTALLHSAGLRWSDLAARIATRSLVQDIAAAVDAPPPPEWEMSSVMPRRTDCPSGASVLANGELQNFGYRQRGSSHEGTPVPDEGAPAVRRGESDAEVGQRLFRDALRASGAPHYEDPATGEIYPPKWVIPGVGQVQPDGTLGPLPADE